MVPCDAEAGGRCPGGAFGWSRWGPGCRVGLPLGSGAGALFAVAWGVPVGSLGGLWVLFVFLLVCVLFRVLLALEGLVVSL